MEMQYITLFLSLVSIAFVIINFAIGRKDKAEKDAKENNQVLINYRLDKIDETLRKINEKLDRYDTEIDEKIEKALENHIAIYHKRSKKGE